MYKGKHKHEITSEELRVEISQCLQIENLNFLIGAGCSSFRDENGEEQAIPTMAGLASQFYGANPDLKVDRKNKAVDLFPTNLEALMNHLVSLGNIISESSRKTLAGKINTLNKFIFGKVCDTPVCPSLLQLYKEFYMRIVKNTRQVPINVNRTPSSRQ